MYSSTLMMDTGPDTYLHVDTHMHTHSQTRASVHQCMHTHRHSEMHADTLTHTGAHILNYVHRPMHTPKARHLLSRLLTCTDLFTHTGICVHTSPGCAHIPIKPHNRWDCMLGAET